MEELKEQSRKMVESGGTGGIDIKFVIIETEPRCEDSRKKAYHRFSKMINGC